MRVSDAQDAAAAAHDVGDAAGVGHREGVGHGEGGVQPVVVGLGAAARQLDKCVSIQYMGVGLKNNAITSNGNE